jgi:hypothetical protein
VVLRRENQVLAEGVGEHDAVLSVELRWLKSVAVGELELRKRGAGTNPEGGPRVSLGSK